LPPIGALGLEGGAVIGGEMLPGRAAFLSQLFPPRQVMLHQKELDLRPAQVEAIKKAVTEAQERLVDIQWRLDGETSTLGKLVAVDHVDEAAALAKLQEVVAIEQEMKNVNFALLVRIKNELDPEQQSKLRMLAPPAFGVRMFTAPVPAP
jgi:Spy/CpxP family protein refolding chaperone